MAEYIDKQKLIDILEARADMAIPDYKPVLLNIAKLVQLLPTAEVEPVRPELRKAVKLLTKNYDRGLNSDYVRNPVAWALHQTWREMDGGADNGNAT